MKWKKDHKMPNTKTRLSDPSLSSELAALSSHCDVMTADVMSREHMMAAGMQGMDAQMMNAPHGHVKCVTSQVGSHGAAAAMQMSLTNGQDHRDIST